MIETLPPPPHNKNKIYILLFSFGRLQAFGIEVDESKNAQTFGGKAGEIQSAASKVRILVIPTDEELSIAEQTLEVVERSPPPAA